MKPTKLFLALAVVMLLGACATKEVQDTQSLTNTYWRNTKTGDWLIGFTEKHVIYDNAIWDIVAMTEQGDAYRMTVSNGEEEHNIKVTPTKEGMRRMVGIAFLFAVPVSYLIMQRWLQGYAYHIDLYWWVFALALLIVLAVTSSIVLARSWRAAKENPVEALYKE